MTKYTTYKQHLKPLEIRKVCAFPLTNVGIVNHIRILGDMKIWSDAFMFGIKKTNR